MGTWKRWRLNQRTRMLVTLQLAVVLPAAALIFFSFANLRRIERDRAVQAAIQRDLSETLKITEKWINEKVRKLVYNARDEFPCPGDGEVTRKLEEILAKHPEFAHAFLFDLKTNTFWVRSNPQRQGDPDFMGEGDKLESDLKTWMPKEAPSLVEKLQMLTQKEGAPYLAFYSSQAKHGDNLVYQSVVYFVPPNLAEGRIAIGGLASDANYLRDAFLPEMLGKMMEKTYDAETGGSRVVMMIHVKKEYEPLVASPGWDGGKPEVERAFEDVFPGLVLAIKYRGTTIEALSEHFLRSNFLVFGGLSLILAVGIWFAFRNVAREMALAKLKSDFVANVSHDLRTPLSLIRLYAETLELGRLTNPEKHQEYYSIIRKESERLTALINNILDFSRIEAGGKEYHFRETNLAELVRNTLDAYRFQIQQNGFELNENIAADLPPVRVDREAIARSLLNLINNALKYSPQDKFLGVNLYRVNGDVRIEVVDHGIGIPRSEQSRIFEKFYRAGDPLVHNTKGSGLGLSLVQHIVQAHGGQVSVESAPGKGSKFTIALPLQYEPRGVTRAEQRDAEVA